MCWQDAAVIAPVVTPEIVAAHPHAVLADVRWYLDGRDGRAAYELAHIPSAVWVDLDRQLAGHGRPASEGRHPFPTPDDLQKDVYWEADNPAERKSQGRLFFD